MPQPSLPTIKRLYAVSGNQCAFPGCCVPLVDDDSGKVTGRVCHIRARQPLGPRYDPSQSDDERNSFGNLLLMCPIHHDIIDSDTGEYTVAKLTDIKTQHEGQAERQPELPDTVAKSFQATMNSHTIHYEDDGADVGSWVAVADLFMAGTMVLMLVGVVSVGRNPVADWALVSICVLVGVVTIVALISVYWRKRHVSRTLHRRASSQTFDDR